MRRVDILSSRTENFAGLVARFERLYDRKMAGNRHSSQRLNLELILRSQIKKVFHHDFAENSQKVVGMVTAFQRPVQSAREPPQTFSPRALTSTENRRLPSIRGQRKSPVASERPDSFAGAPADVESGKSFSREGRGYGTPTAPATSTTVERQHQRRWRQSPATSMTAAADVSRP